jgi:site-specific recombinase XerD
MTRKLRVCTLSLPPILAGFGTPQVRKQAERFFYSIADIFEAWVTRRKSRHTQRAYREDVMSFVRFLKITWPQESIRLLSVSIRDVLAFRDDMLRRDLAPKTLNRRISSLSSFYKYLAAAAAELRLPITVPNPAHAQFIARESTDPRDETKALSAARARQFIALPAGETILDYRDRAILKLYVYSGIRLATGCRLNVSDFHEDGEEATIRLHEKGDKRRTIGLHSVAAGAIAEYLEKAEIRSGPLFRPRLNPRSTKLGKGRMNETTMYRLIESYLKRLPGAVKELENSDGTTTHRSIYTPHSLRATTATLLLNARVDIRKVQDLLGHRHITTTQIYDKRRRTTSESASHELPL